MSWYKQSQASDVSMDKIIWAIDDILLKEHDYTIEDLIAAEQRMGYSQVGVAKAAQATKTRRRSKKPKTEEQMMRHLIDQGYSNRNISNELDIPIEDVTEFVRELFPRKKDQSQYLKDINEEGILDMTDAFGEHMSEDINAPIISSQKIADALGGMNVEYVKKTLKANGVQLDPLVKERIAKTEEMMVSVVKGMEEPYTVKDIQREFEAQHNHKLSGTKLDRMLKYRNIVTKQMHTNQAILFTAFKRFLGTKAIAVKDVPFHDPQKITKILDEFIVLKGPDHGFTTPMDQMKLKQLFMTKIQLRDRAMEQGENRQWLQDFPDYGSSSKIRNMLELGTTAEELIRAFPKIKPNVLQKLFHTYQTQRAPMMMDDTQPSYFLGAQSSRSDKMNWYKKARKGVPGGIADHKKPSDFNKKQLDMGVEVEMEHTDDRDLSKDITMDHLEEFSTYYTELEKMEKRLEEKKLEDTKSARRGRYRGGIQRLNRR
jgi:hypothetical protein